MDDNTNKVGCWLKYLFPYSNIRLNPSRTSYIKNQVSLPQYTRIQQFQGRQYKLGTELQVIGDCAQVCQLFPNCIGYMTNSVYTNSCQLMYDVINFLVKNCSSTFTMYYQTTYDLRYAVGIPL